jgi:hypothetical protein
MRSTDCSISFDPHGFLRPHGFFFRCRAGCLCFDFLFFSSNLFITRRGLGLAGVWGLCTCALVIFPFPPLLLSYPDRVRYRLGSVCLETRDGAAISSMMEIRAKFGRAGVFQVESFSAELRNWGCQEDDA